MKAISPLIATIILIAVTIAIATVVIAWVYGIFGTTTGAGEKLQIFADARLLVISTNNAIFNVTAKNIGTTNVSIKSIYIKESASCKAEDKDIQVDSGSASNTPLKPGDVKMISATFSCSLNVGTTYNVVIVTSGGQAYIVPVTAEQGS